MLSVKLNALVMLSVCSLIATAYFEHLGPFAQNSHSSASSQPPKNNNSGNNNDNHSGPSNSGPTTSSNGPSNCKAHPYNVTLYPRNQYSWPWQNECGHDEFYGWFNNHHQQHWLGNTIYFDRLDRDALSQVHLEHETLVFNALVFDVDDINYQHVNIAMNGFRGLALNQNAVTVQVLRQVRVNNLRLNDHDLYDYDDDRPVIRHSNSMEHHEPLWWRSTMNWDKFLDALPEAWEARHRHDEEWNQYNNYHNIHTVTLVEVSLHLEDYVFGINRSAADLFRASAKTNGTVDFKVTHMAGYFRASDGQLNLQGNYPGNCPSPSPTQTPTPHPTATPKPTPTPTHGPSPTPTPKMTPTPTPQPSPSPTPLPPPPTVTINNTSVGALTNSSNVQIMFSANETATFKCSLDASTYATCASPYSQSGLADGMHNFSVEAVDSFGQPSQPALFQWNIDTTVPVATFGTIAPADAETTSTQITLNFSANEQSTFICSLDNAAESACSSPVALNDLGDGSHTFTVTPTDMAGNVGNSISHTWVVKTVPPSIIFSQIIPSNTPSNSTARTFYYTATADAVSFSCSLDSGAPSACTSPYAVTGLADGSHTVSVVAFDAVGNQSVPAVSSFIIDTIPPSTIITSTVPNQSPTNNASIQISFSANESATFNCILDGSPATSCTSPMTYSALSDGSHIAQVVATDSAGNVDPTGATYKWTIDTMAPVLTLVSENPSVADTNQKQITLDYSVSETATIACSLDGKPSMDCTSGTITYSSLDDGAHNVKAIATDTAGNVSTPVTYNWTVDTEAPVVQITAENPTASITNIKTMSLSFTANKVATFQCQLDGAPFSTCTSPKSYSGLADGTHTFTVQGMDQAGNVSATPATYSWMIDTIAPTTQITAESPSDSPTNSTTETLTFSASETSTFLCSLDGAGATPCSSPITYNGLADSTHTFNVFATDLAGNTDAVGATYTWTINTQPLNITNFGAFNVGKTTAVISWTTNVPATTQVFYALFPSTTYTSTTLDPTPTTSHTVTLTGLTSNGFYSVYGMSVYGSEPPAQSAVTNFRTLGGQ